MTGIFISSRKLTNYNLKLPLQQNRIIVTFRNLFKQSDLTEIESLLVNSMLQPL